MWRGERGGGWERKKKRRREGGIEGRREEKRRMREERIEVKLRRIPPSSAHTQTHCGH